MPRTTVGDLIRQRRAEAHLSQLDLALAAGVSARHLGFVELGRSRPSPRLILTLAQSMDVPLRQRNQWLLAAGYAPHYPETPLAGAELERVRGNLRQLLDAHDPYPGVAVDRRWDVQIANQAAWRMVAGVPERIRGLPANVFRAALHPEGLAPLTANFESWSAYLLEQLSRLAAQDPLAAGLAAEIEAWPGIPPRSQWAAAPGPDTGGPVLTWEISLGGQALRLHTVMASLGAATDVTLSELTLELFYPADQETENWLRSQRD
jgi:transcriptional regulator with XRE-family HTH domain